MDNYNLCIIKPNKNAFSETFIQEHIDRLAGKKFVLYGGAFPVYDHKDNYLIKSKLGLINYLIQKKLLKRKNIGVRTRALVNYLKDQKIDVVLAEYGMVGAMVTEACKIAKVPLIIHFHGADAHHKETVANYRDLYKKAFDYAGKIIVVSNDMARAIEALGAPSGKIILNPYGVDTSKFSKADVAFSAVNFLAVGRFVEKKAPLSVVKAFNIVSEKFPKARLWMVGNGSLFDETKELISQLNLTGKIKLTGVLSSADIQKLMQQMRCFVQHSVTAANGDMEGTPNTILEASSSGLPVVSTLHAGIKEAVINGKTGYLVPEHHIDDMAEKIMIFAENPALAAQFGAAGREHIIKNYDMSRSIAALNKIISGAINHVN